MPITRRRRANPPEQPEQTNLAAEQPTEQVVDNGAIQQATESPKEGEGKSTASAATPARPENNPPASPAYPASFAVAQPPATPVLSNESRSESSEVPPTPPQQRAERTTRVERAERHERHEYAPSIEGGRRTSRGELFRRPPQMPAPMPVQPPVSAAPLQPPSHEISLPLGNLLHLAYNPGYTGSDEARSALLQKLANESKAGGRARCWSCGSLAIVYDRWNTRSKTFGEVGIAFCEICGVWSVM